MPLIKTIYDGNAKEYDRHPYCKIDSLGSIIEIASQKYLFKKYKIGLSGKKVLDIGCGTGRTAEIFQKFFGAKVFASDFSAKMVKTLKKKRLKVSMLIEDALELSEKSSKFNLVNSSWVINHIENYKKAVSEMARVAKPGGYVLITVVNPPEIKNCSADERGNLRYDVALFGKKSAMSLYRRSKEEYVRAMEASGLKVLEVSDKTFGELEELGAVEGKDAKKFDDSSRKVRVNLTILAKKPADSH